MQSIAKNFNPLFHTTGMVYSLLSFYFENMLDRPDMFYFMFVRLD